MRGIQRIAGRRRERQRTWAEIRKIDAQVRHRLQRETLDRTPRRLEEARIVLLEQRNFLPHADTDMEVLNGRCRSARPHYLPRDWAVDNLILRLIDARADVVVITTDHQYTMEVTALARKLKSAYPRLAVAIQTSHTYLVPPETADLVIPKTRRPEDLPEALERFVTERQANGKPNSRY